MTVEDLLSDIDARYRNTYSAETKLRWMNYVYKHILRLAHEDNTRPAVIMTEAGVGLYALSASIRPQDVKGVAIETEGGSGKFEAATYSPIDQNSKGGSTYSYLDGYLMISPTPKESKILMLYVYGAPADLQLGDVPKIMDSHIELLVWGTLERIAAARGEGEDKANFGMEFNALMSDYLQLCKVYRPSYATIKDVTKPRRGGMSRGRNMADLIP